MATTQALSEPFCKPGKPHPVLRFIGGLLNVFWHRITHPTFSQDLTLAKDHEIIPKLAANTDGLKTAHDHTVASLALKKSWLWWLIYKYISIQSYFCIQQFASWKQTTEDLTTENNARKSGPWRRVCGFLWSFTNIVDNFSNHWISRSVSIFLLLVPWLGTTTIPLPIAYRLHEWANFVGGIGTHSRNWLIILSFFRQRNIVPLVVLRYLTKRGLTLLVLLSGLSVPAFDESRYYLHKTSTYINKVIAGSVTWGNLVLFYSEILFLLAVTVAFLCRWISPLTECERDDLQQKYKSLHARAVEFQYFKEEQARALCRISKEACDIVLQNTFYNVILLNILLGEGITNLYKDPSKDHELQKSFLRRLLSLFWSLLSKLLLMAVTGAVAFAQTYPFRNGQPLQYTEKLVWSASYGSRMLLCLLPWRDFDYMLEQFNLLVAGAIYQIVGISVPSFKHPEYLEKKQWFWAVLSGLVASTNWISELPGDLVKWLAEQVHHLGNLWRKRANSKSAKVQAEDHANVAVLKMV